MEKTGQTPSVKKRTKKSTPKMFDVESLAKEAGTPGWETAAMMRAVGWASGKQVTKDQFEKALKTFRNRPQGGGRIQV